jgi:hypothetical protein
LTGRLELRKAMRLFIALTGRESYKNPPLKNKIEIKN